MLNSAQSLSQLLAKFTASTSHIFVSANVALVSVLVLAANTSRKGLWIYNNSANSVYVCFGQAASSSTSMTAVIPTFTQLIVPMPVYTGAIYAIRNSGSGTLLITELT